VLSMLAIGALLAACKPDAPAGEGKVAVGQDKSREGPAPSASPSAAEVTEHGTTARSDQKMVPGLDQGHTPGPADTTMPLKPGTAPLDDAGAAPKAPPTRITK
jgi:hypothetical protein